LWLQTVSSQGNAGWFCRNRAITPDDADTDGYVNGNFIKQGQNSRSYAQKRCACSVLRQKATEADPTVKWDHVDQQVCSVARALSVVGERWTLLIVRDAFKGTRRFDEFYRNLGVTRHRLTERLNGLVDSGVMTKVPYSERPVRYEYRLTRKGLALYPILLTLSHWGDEWLAGPEGAPTDYWHTRCGKVTQPQVTCANCGDLLRPEEVSARHGQVLEAFTHACRERNEPIPSEAALPAAAAEFNRVWRADNAEEQP
jgi:DNA-binding HxlR family transcriptional regulator